MDPFFGGNSREGGGASLHPVLALACVTFLVFHLASCGPWKAMARVTHPRGRLDATRINARKREQDCPNSTCTGPVFRAGPPDVFFSNSVKLRKCGPLSEHSAGQLTLPRCKLQFTLCFFLCVILFMVFVICSFFLILKKGARPSFWWGKCSADCSKHACTAK